MELLIKIALVVLALNVLVIGPFICYLIYCLITDITFETFSKSADLNIEHQQFDALEKQCQELINSDEKTKKYCAHYGLGLLETKRKNFDNAIEHFESAITLIPSIQASHFRLVDIMFMLKDIDRGFYYILRGIDSNILFESKFFTYIGMLFLANSNNNEAIKMFEIAQKRDLNSPTPKVGIAIAHFLNRNNTLAIDCIREARKVINTDKADHTQANEWAKGLLALMHGDAKEAKYIFEYYKESSNFGPVFEIILERIEQVFKPES